jgi:hypothetical protein
VEDEEDDNKPLLSSSEPELEAQSPHLLGNQMLYTVFFTYLILKIWHGTILLWDFPV